MIHLNDFVASQVQKEGLKSQPGTYYFFRNEILVLFCEEYCARNYVSLFCF